MRKPGKGWLILLAFTLILSTAAPALADPEDSEDPDESIDVPIEWDADAPPDIVGEMAIIVDMDTGEILYSKAGDQRGYPASTTKIVTALLFAEERSPDDTLFYTQSALDQPSYSLHRDYGPIPLEYAMQGRDVMDALLIYSANDVAAMVADDLGGDQEGFVEMVNSYFDSLGLENTQFANPNGVHSEEHYTTAYELSILTREAFSNPWIREVLQIPEVNIPTPRGTVRALNSNRKLQNGDPVFSKTGYTPAAGRCLVALYERDGRRLAGVVLDSFFDNEDTVVFRDMDLLMDWGFNHAERTVAFAEGVTLDYLTLEYRPLRFFGPTYEEEIPAVLAESFSYFANEVNENELDVDYTFDEGITIRNLDSETSIGTAVFRERERETAIDLYPEFDGFSMFRRHTGLYLGTFFGGLIGLILIAGLIGALRRINRKRNKNVRF